MRYGEQQASIAVSALVPMTTAYAALLASDTSRQRAIIWNPTANGILSLSFDGGATLGWEVPAGSGYLVPENLTTLPISGKVATGGNVSVTAFR